MNVLKTLQFMKPEIHVLVWENDIDKIQYNETETFRPTKQEILSVDQNLVEALIAQEAAQQKIDTKEQLLDQLDLLTLKVKALP